MCGNIILKWNFRVRNVKALTGLTCMYLTVETNDGVHCLVGQLLASGCYSSVGELLKADVSK